LVDLLLLVPFLAVARRTLGEAASKSADRRFLDFFDLVFFEDFVFFELFFGDLTVFGDLTLFTLFFVDFLEFFDLAVAEFGDLAGDLTGLYGVTGVKGLSGATVIGPIFAPIINVKFEKYIREFSFFFISEKKA
jgi:hypothetical protein